MRGGQCIIFALGTLDSTDTNIVNLDRYPAPDLVVEIAKTTLLDDLGTKRSLYEELGVAEYWVVDAGSSGNWLPNPRSRLSAVECCPGATRIGDRNFRRGAASESRE